LDGGANFSDGFIAGIATLEQDVLVDELLECNSLWGMWTLLHKQMGDAIDGIGCEMGVSYRHQVDGSMIGFKTLEYDEAMLNRHLEEVMKWWKGERGTTGVDIEEAWKCRSCEFEAECTWRLGKIEELKKRNQRLTKSR